MDHQQEPASDINGTLWVLFKSTGKDAFEFKEVQREGMRHILVFTTHDKASTYEAKYARDYRAITFENTELWNDFFKRRASEGVGYIELDPYDLAGAVQIQPIRNYIQSIPNK